MSLNINSELKANDIDSAIHRINSYVSNDEKLMSKYRMENSVVNFAHDVCELKSIDIKILKSCDNKVDILVKLVDLINNQPKASPSPTLSGRTVRKAEAARKAKEMEEKKAAEKKAAELKAAEEKKTAEQKADKPKPVEKKNNK